MKKAGVALKRKLQLASPKMRLALFIVGFAVIGGLLLLLSHAATGTYSFDPEGGTRSGNIALGSDGTASGGSYVKFGVSAGTCPTGQVGTPPNCVSASSALAVNAGTIINNFNPSMKGIGLANWTFQSGWGRSYVGQLQNLPQALNAINPGLIRYAGGLWANDVGFDRTKTQILAYTTWTKNGNTYSFDYGTDELASVNAFANSINSDVMIQVNLSDNDPAMWADLVAYAKQQGWTRFKYYEFANEMDLETFTGAADAITPAQYGSRLTAYQNAMLAADPTIKIVGGVPAGANDIMRNNYSSGGDQVSQYIIQALSAAHSAGHDLGAVSFHWYQTDQGSSSTDDVFKWTNGKVQTGSDWWQESYSRNWGTTVGSWVKSKAMSAYPSMPLGISELGVNSGTEKPTNGNHVGALWFSDELGRLAYGGVDWVTEWDSYAAQNEDFSLLYPDNDSATSGINARPTYYAYLMYAKYFGNQMVKSSSYDDSKISIWASKDTNDPNKLKLRITNMTGAAINAPIALTGFNTTGGQGYVMSSTNPLDTSASSDLSSAPTTINGVKINANNVAASVASIVPNTVTASGTSFSYNIPAYSSAAIVLSGTFQ